MISIGYCEVNKLMCIFSINVNRCAYLSIDVNTYKFRSSLYRYYEYCIHVNALYIVQQITIEWSKSIPHIESVAWCAVLSIAFPPQSHTIWDCNIDWFWMVRNLSWFTAYLSMLVGRLGRYIPTIGTSTSTSLYNWLTQEDSEK